MSPSLAAVEATGDRYLSPGGLTVCEDKGMARETELEGGGAANSHAFSEQPIGD